MFLQERMCKENTVLSPFGAETDMVPLLFNWFNTPKIYRFMGDIDQFPFTWDDARSYFSSHHKDTWLVCEKDESGLIPIGYTGIFIRKRHAIGIFRIAIVETGAQGKGHACRATELILDWAFLECDLRSVHLSVSAANVRAIKLYEKVGFEVCGRFSNSRFENGKVFDEILMELPKERYLNR